MAANSRSRARAGKPKLRDRLTELLRYDTLWTVLAIVVIVVITAPQLRFAEPDYRPGDIALSDVTAPIDLTVPDPVSTERRLTEADRSVPDVYDHNPLTHEYGKGVVRELFQWGRANIVDAGVAWDELDAEQQADLEQAAMAAVGRTLPVGLVARLAREPNGFAVATELAVSGAMMEFSRDHLFGAIEETRTGGADAIIVRGITTQRDRRLSSAATVLDMAEARTGMQAALRERLELSDEAEAAVADFAGSLLPPNLNYNSNATQLRRLDAREAVEPGFYEVRRGRVLLRQGDEVTSQDLLELEALRQQYRNDRSLVSLLGIATLMALAVISLWRYVIHFQKRVRYQRVERLYLLALIVLIGMVALTRGSLFLGEAVANAAPQEPFSSVESYEFAVPFASGGVLLMLLVNVQVAWAFAGVFAVVVGAMTQDLTLTVFALLSSFAALYGMSQYKQRTALTRAGLIVGGINGIAVLGLSLLEQPIAPTGVLLFHLVCAVAGGLLMSIVVTIAIPPLEHMFQCLTDIKLLELSNMNLPLLKELAVSAPGTYHHSVVVGTLSEKAAEAIGVNPLFCRVAAYYHDIGKLRQPQYFVENQKDGRNPHDNLSPNMSALILVSHVKDGVAYAKEQGLPKPMIAAIQEHHGTRLIRFFHEKAKQLAESGGREVVESDFRYPGPKPQSKETAILMLADGVEATSRTMTDTSPGKLRAMIRRSLQDVVNDDQLVECSLTLEDLAKIADAFLSVLAGMHHQRIEYPESTEAERPGLSVGLQDEDSGSQLSDQTYH